MLLDLNVRKAAATLGPLIDAPISNIAIRPKLEAFAASEGLQL
jgi:phosphotransferase system enzyme I (PtsP)